MRPRGSSRRGRPLQKVAGAASVLPVSPRRTSSSLRAMQSTERQRRTVSRENTRSRRRLRDGPYGSMPMEYTTCSTSGEETALFESRRPPLICLQPCSTATPSETSFPVCLPHGRLQLRRASAAAQEQMCDDTLRTVTRFSSTPARRILNLYSHAAAKPSLTAAGLTK